MKKITIILICILSFSLVLAPFGSAYAGGGGGTSRYTVTFNTQGGSIVDSVSVIAGNSLVFPTPPTYVGKTFLGWSLTPNGALLDTLIPTANTTLYAVWEDIYYTVTFNTQGGSTFDNLSILYGESFTFPIAPTKEGYIFLGWSLTPNGALLDTIDPPTITTDITLYAQWQINSTLAELIISPISHIIGADWLSLVPIVIVVIGILLLFKR